MNTSASEHRVATARAQARRRAWVAALLCLVVPALGMLYLGRGRRAVVYLLVEIAAFVLSFVLMAKQVLGDGAQFHPLAYLVTLVSIVDAIRIARTTPGDFRGPWFSRRSGILGCAAGFAMAVLAVRGFIVEPYRIASDGMLPTLHVSDYILVDKLAYGLRLPFAGGYLRASDPPRRGDVVAFRASVRPGDVYVKRVIGLPGDRVEVKGRELILNGVAVPATPDGFYRDVRHGVAPQMTEHLDASTHPLLYLGAEPTRAFPVADHSDPGACRYDSGNVDCTVPPDKYYVLGDNRDNSEDSRHWGFVPLRDILGRVTFIWLNDREPRRAGLSVP